MPALAARLPDVLGRLRAVQVTVTALAMLVGTLAGPADASGGTISGVAFHDLDRDGVHEAGEPVFEGHQLTLIDATTVTYVGTTVTDAEGRYAFTGLADHDYRLDYASGTWQEIRDSWASTTSPTLRPATDLRLAGSATVDFGWRPITWSTELARPIDTHVAPDGLRVETFNDVFTAEQLSDVVHRGAVGEEAPHVTVRFAYGSTSSTTIGVQGTPGSYSNFNAVSYVSYDSWLSNGETTLSHEYGHAWSLYRAYILQQDATLSSYLEARGLTGDSRLDSSYGWNRRELVAEDYRQLLGSPQARQAAQANRELPPADQVPGLVEFLTGPFSRAASDGGAGSTEDPAPAPTTDVTAPTVAISAPAAGSRVDGTVRVVVAADDDAASSADLIVEVSVDGGAWQRGSYDPVTGAHTLTWDTGTVANGDHVLRARATDPAGNVASSDARTVEVRNRGGGKSGSTTGGGKGGGRKA